MAWWNRKKLRQEIRDATLTLESLLLSTSNGSTISKEQAMTIPAFNSGIDLISDIVASIPIKLYKKDGNKVQCVDDDPRVELLNVTTGDTLDGFQMKKAFIEDHFVYGAGYIYKNMVRNNFKSLHYVSNPQVGVALVNPDPIFKKLEFVIYGNVYQDYQLIKLTRKTRDGVTGIGLLQEANKLLSVAYNTLVFEDMLVSAGGNKKGFLKSASRLSKDAITELKTALTNFYANNGSNFMVLNNGLDFQEANNSSVEMQINQNKITNNEEISKLLKIPVELLNGKATGGNEILFESTVKIAISPILKAFETALNKDFLLEKEKGSFYFAGDTTELVKADILKRFQAYQLAIDSGILQVDEIRGKEGYEPLGLEFIKLGLQDVLYNPITKEIYTPNTNKMAKMGQDNIPEPVPVVGESPKTGVENNQDEGGETNANRDPGESGPS
ncbi:phage portal protein [Pullulanibacillus sp. KACC 23026]|uniref:phage portal protein n=1 Tax=Pullulanibacillus sp. KACC 23026 TaxID=3028315 RepID=UPI0023AE7759|nr:phage portal protein [Pullulanibacillus sp. KACC 23026]WEG13996.1 phage portal protein [Pullulanibacillus sp. KACC 23026]